MNSCVFCKIVKKEIKSEIVFEGTNVLAFKDSSPSADTHILIVPKKHISSFTEIKKIDGKVVLEMMEVAQKLIKEKKLQKKYKLVINGGEYQFVPHLHLHLLGGEVKKHDF